jgi:hypothetical protein
MAHLRAMARHGGALVFGIGVLLSASVGCTRTEPLPPGLTPAPAGTPAASVAAVLGPGYVESEYFYTGTANTYRPSGTWGSDGRWGKVVDRSAQRYSTRFVVDRPVDPARFNGTVWVEWLNVTGGSDGAPSVIQARDHVKASGAAWIGISAQKGGVNAIKQANPNRYGRLDVSSGALSYDIFTQVAQAVRDHPEVLGGSRPQRLLAVGNSQSALRLATYVNAFPQESTVYDGVFIHSRFTSGGPLVDDGSIMGAVPTRIRSDASRPVLQLQTEIEVGLNLESLMPGLGTWESVRQPDQGNVHTWEVAGAAHADKYLLNSIGGGGGDTSGFTNLLGCGPMNDFPFHYAANAAFASMERWAGGGARPAAAPPIETVNGLVQRDADGNARGGLRLPDIDVPVARYNGGTTANVLCDLFGSTTPFTAAQLRTRYGTTAAYTDAYRSHADAAVTAGIMTPADRDAAVAAAGTRPIGP